MLGHTKHTPPRSAVPLGQTQASWPDSMKVSAHTHFLPSNTRFMVLLQLRHPSKLHVAHLTEQQYDWIGFASLYPAIQTQLSLIAFIRNLFGLQEVQITTPLVMLTQVWQYNGHTEQPSVVFKYVPIGHSQVPLLFTNAALLQAQITVVVMFTKWELLLQLVQPNQAHVVQESQWTHCPLTGLEFSVQYVHWPFI